MKLKLPAGDFRAYLSDCDGTVVDSMPLHFIAWRKALGEWNCEFTEEQHYAWGGRPTPEIVAELNRINGLRMPVHAIVRRKEERYFELLPELKPVPEVLEHIEREHGRIPMAVVSGSTRDSVVRSLSTLKLLDKFDTIVGAEDYERSKPAPDAYLIAVALGWRVCAEV